MSQLKMTDLQPSAIEAVREKVEGSAAIMEKVIDEIITPYCKPLDDYVQFIGKCLNNGETPPTDDELDDFCLNLSTQIYFTASLCERLGVRDDISRSVYKEIYHNTRNNLEYGTVADKDSVAELESQQEQITNICYSRAYKIVKNKVDAAQELLSSCKKVLSRRMSDAELSRISVTK